MYLLSPAGIKFFLTVLGLQTGGYYFNFNGKRKNKIPHCLNRSITFHFNVIFYGFGKLFKNLKNLFSVLMVDLSGCVIGGY